MHNPQKINYWPRQHGMALLVFLALILIMVTAIAVSHLSLNAQSTKKILKATDALAQARNALMAYALADPVRGSLPCPDTNNDGLEDVIANDCASATRRGLLPYKTLNIPELTDGAGQHIWYVAATGYAGADSIDLAPHNRSRVANLTIDGGTPMVFIVIAPNTSLSGQSPGNPTPANIGQYLEGENTTASNNYSTLYDADHNDKLMGMSAADFWTPIEKVLALP